MMDLSNIPTLSRPKMGQMKFSAGIVDDPVKHLVAACAKQAVVDLFWPSKDVHQEDRLSALEFVYSDVGQDILMYVGLSWNRIVKTLGLETVNEQQRNGA
jgi:hypothetical protein